MVEVERERYNEDRFQIEHEVECDDKTAIEGEGSMFISDDNSATLWGAPPDWHPPHVPPNWTPKPVQVDKGEPPFHKVDNPGGWSGYTYQAVINKTTGEYLHHTMPSSATAVPIDPKTNKREVGGYEFFYKAVISLSV